MQYSREVEEMVCVAKGPNHGPAPIPEEGKWIQAKEIKDISGYTHGIGWCAPQQGACKLSLNVKNGIIEEALVETVGCSGMTHSAAMASEILPGKTILEALNTDLVCDAINTAMRELFLQIVYGRTQSAFSDDGLRIGAGPWFGPLATHTISSTSREYCMVLPPSCARKNSWQIGAHKRAVYHIRCYYTTNLLPLKAVARYFTFPMEI